MPNPLQKELNAFDEYIKSGDPVICISEEQKEWIKSFLRTSHISLIQEVIKMAEKTIEEERYSGTPHSINKLITSLEESIK